MRPDANRIALSSIRSILAAAQPLELDVGGTKVTCTVTQRPPEPWPSASIAGIAEATDGPWPGPVVIACAWQNGKCRLEMHCMNEAGRNEPALAVFVDGRGTPIVWMNLPKRIRDNEDGARIHMPSDVFLKKRKVAGGAPEVQQRLSELLQALVAASSLPAESKKKVRAFDFELPSGAVEPSPAIAFRQVVHLTLFKLDFFDRGANAKERGRPLVDIAKRTGLSAKVLESVTVADPDDDDNDEERSRRYWAGGFQWGNESKRDEFVKGNYWKVAWARDAKEAAAQTTWRRFDDLMPGDLFAIKGYGGEHDLVIHYVGEVLAVDGDAGRVSLKRLDTPLFHGEAPRNAGAGNWRDTLVPITRKDVIATIFGEGAAQNARPPHAYDDIPLNLILYGPPGTGKTYRLQTDYVDRFTRREEEVRDVDATPNLVADLTYFEVILAALHSLPERRGTVDEINAHPLVRAKYQANAPKHMRQIVSGQLQGHTIENSKTVGMKRRIGDLVFDKDSAGRWFIAAPLSAELKEMIERTTHQPSTPREVKDYDFITFHQAYSYEDFIEGIRPQVDPSAESDEEGSVGYVLEAGIFKKAVLKALQRTGFGGTIDDFCALTRDERAKLFDGAPHYAVFIDEINRGNVARILGELITLLEDDKRLGAENELIVRLPYSGRLFGVPPNLHVIGTMNTADRSVEALDAALRRRFEFEELAPQPEELKFMVDGPIDPRRLLQTINRRLEKLRDRDHCIGHAYLLPLEKERTLDALKQVFAAKILPLLQEYFFGDWGKIGLVLGKEFVRRRQDATELADFDHDDRDVLMSRPVYELVPMAELTDQSFRRIYEAVSEDA